MKSLNLKRDKFRKARGGHARVLEIRCEKCGHFLALYQKDGPGPLKRMYIDRILSPQYLAGFFKIPLKKLPQLACKSCQRLIGIPYLYEKEKRPAFRLFVGAVTKKISRVT
ncbi:MAG: hypothetical protein AAB424_00490 [Patescibacteria group bacterium]